MLHERADASTGSVARIDKEIAEDGFDENQKTTITVRANAFNLRGNTLLLLCYTTYILSASRSLAVGALLLASRPAHCGVAQVLHAARRREIDTGGVGGMLGKRGLSLHERMMFVRRARRIKMQPRLEVQSRLHDWRLRNQRFAASTDIDARSCVKGAIRPRCSSSSARSAGTGSL